MLIPTNFDHHRLLTDKMLTFVVSSPVTAVTSFSALSNCKKESWNVCKRGKPSTESSDGATQAAQGTQTRREKAHLKYCSGHLVVAVTSPVTSLSAIVACFALAAALAFALAASRSALSAVTSPVTRLTALEAVASLFATFSCAVTGPVASLTTLVAGALGTGLGVRAIPGDVSRLLTKG